MKELHCWIFSRRDSVIDIDSNKFQLKVWFVQYCGIVTVCIPHIAFTLGIDSHCKGTVSTLKNASLKNHNFKYDISYISMIF